MLQLPLFHASVLNDVHYGLPAVDQTRSAAEIADLVSYFPTVHLIGFPKCGSSTLYVLLTKIPGLLFPTPKDPAAPKYFLKEAHFFDDSARYEKGLAFYGDFYPKLHQKEAKYVAVDATPSILNLEALHSMSNVYDHHPHEHHFIISFREPFSALLSYWNHLREMPSKSDVFEDYLRKELSKNVSQCSPHASWWQHRHKLSIENLESSFMLHCPKMIGYYMFAIYLELWVREFPLKSTNYCLFFMDDLAGDQNIVIQSLHKCLKLPEMESELLPLKGVVRDNTANSYRPKHPVSTEVRAMVDALYQPWLCVLKSFLRGKFNKSRRRLNEIPWIPTGEQCYKLGLSFDENGPGTPMRDST